MAQVKGRAQGTRETVVLSSRLGGHSCSCCICGQARPHLEVEVGARGQEAAQPARHGPCPGQLHSRLHLCHVTRCCTALDAQR